MHFFGELSNPLWHQMRDWKAKSQSQKTQSEQKDVTPDEV